MKTVTAKELKNRTGTILRSVNKGERVVVTKRGKPCAIISPVQGEQLQAGELRSYPEAWADLEKMLQRSTARHKTWKDALKWSRRRA